MIARRTLLAAAPAALAAPARASDLAVRGSKAYSESAMVMTVSLDDASAMTLRFCRFPVEGQTWLWCHVFHEGRFYAFTSHDLPCTSERLAGVQLARYDAPPLKTELVRLRRGGKLLPMVRFSGELMFHESRSAPHGAGKVPGRIHGQFLGVSPLGAQVLEGREEIYGFCDGEVEIGGRRLTLNGLAKFHEQRQEAPRFEQPFCYSWLAGDSANATTLLGARGARGGWQLDGVEKPLGDMVLDPPGDERKIIWKFKDGSAETGRLKAFVRYEVPVYDRKWTGSFVKGEGPGRDVVGVMNDWAGPPDIYAAARARAAV
ncbi:hypothetical protein [Phenylobacterium sp.]|uniref:hypothetical protein n=1 Tax=Phenylobacterium sp. TaxID=1871053 RepID=UPI002ED8416D